VALITTRGEAYHPNRRLLEAARARGVSLGLFHPWGAWPMVGREGGLGLAGPEAALARAEVILPRLGATISPYTLALVRHLELMGRRVVNRARAIALASHKPRTLQSLQAAGLPVPPAVVVYRRQDLEAAAQALGGWPLVAKLASARQGRGVFLLQGPQELPPEAEPGRAGLVLQRFVPPRGRRDLRVLVVGGRAVAAMALEPAPGEFRANVHLGGRPRAVELEPAWAGLAQRAAAALGLELAGVDLMLTPRGGPWLVEVNYTPGFRGLEEATGRDIAGLILDYALSPTPGTAGAV